MNPQSRKLSTFVLAAVFASICISLLPLKDDVYFFLCIYTMYLKNENKILMCFWAIEALLINFESPQVKLFQLVLFQILIKFPKLYQCSTHLSNLNEMQEVERVTCHTCVMTIFNQIVSDISAIMGV